MTRRLEIEKVIDFNCTQEYIRVCAHSEVIQERCPEDKTPLQSIERDIVYISPRGNYFIRLSHPYLPAPYYSSPVTWIPQPDNVIQMTWKYVEV